MPDYGGERSIAAAVAELRRPARPRRASAHHGRSALLCSERSTLQTGPLRDRASRTQPRTDPTARRSQSTALVSDPPCARYHSASTASVSTSHRARRSAHQDAAQPSSRPAFASVIPPPMKIASGRGRRPGQAGRPSPSMIWTRPGTSRSILRRARSARSACAPDRWPWPPRRLGTTRSPSPPNPHRHPTAAHRHSDAGTRRRWHAGGAGDQVRRARCCRPANWGSVPHASTVAASAGRRMVMWARLSNSVQAGAS